MRNFVIAGAGEVGRGIAQALIYERKNVILVDPNPDALKQASTLECLLISGDILTDKAMDLVGILNCEMFIAVTDSDERNILACTFAKRVFEMRGGNPGSMVAIARVNRMPLFREMDSSDYTDWTGIDHIANADKVIVEELTAGLVSPQILHTVPMGNGTLICVSRVAEGSNLIGGPLLQNADAIDGLPPPIGIVGSGGRSSIVNETTEAEMGDLLLFAATGSHVQTRITSACGFVSKPMVDHPRVIIFGATPVGKDLAQHYLAKDSNVTVVEPDLISANDLVGSEAGNHRRLDVIHGEPDDVELLKDIGIANHDIAISTMDDDNGAIAIAMRAVDEGVERAGLLVDDSTLVDTVRRIGLTRAVSRREVTVGAVLEHVHSYVEGRFQIIRHAKEFVAMTVMMSEGHKYTGWSLDKVQGKLKSDAKIVALERVVPDRGLITFPPDGEMVLEVEDRIVIVGLRDSIQQVEAKLRS
ncbi:MAG: hypothetical protein CMA23_005925 [Methanobacteriota archaeon]|nr:MAG: hypothetical protein CBE15_04530 [Euryarchaeota archaeon TMED255]RAH09250.1 MAG: hypothetical protein CMA23_005925 [Euryarchaeota archaeon]